MLYEGVRQEKGLCRRILCPLLSPASQLWDFDRIGKDKLIGTLRLPIAKASVQDGPDTPTWHTVHLDLLESGSGSVNTTAVIQRPELLVGLQVRVRWSCCEVDHGGSGPLPATV